MVILVFRQTENNFNFQLSLSSKMKSAHTASLVWDLAAMATHPKEGDPHNFQRVTPLIFCQNIPCVLHKGLWDEFQQCIVDILIDLIPMIEQ